MVNLAVPEWIELIRKSFASVGVIVRQRPVLNFSNKFTLTDDQRNARTNIDVATSFDDSVAHISGALFTGEISGPTASFTLVSASVVSSNQLNIPASTVPNPQASSGFILFASASRPTFVDFRGGQLTLFAPTRSEITATGQTLSPGVANDWYCTPTATTTSSLATSGSLEGSVVSIANFASSFVHHVQNELGLIIWSSRPNHNELVDFRYGSSTWGSTPGGLKTFK